MTVQMAFHRLRQGEQNLGQDQENRHGGQIGYERVKGGVCRITGHGEHIFIIRPADASQNRDGRINQGRG